MASRVLSTLYQERGLIEPVGHARGRGVRYRLAQERGILGAEGGASR